MSKGTFWFLKKPLFICRIKRKNSGLLIELVYNRDCFLRGCHDSDNNAFVITGGNLFGISGGGNSSPTSGTTQKYATPSCSAQKGTRISICDASGNVIMSALNASNANSPKLFVSSPSLTTGTSYKVMTGGTITGGTTNYEITVGGTLSGATQSTTFTVR